MGLRIELIGAPFRNKGAELMLRTAAMELGERLPDAALFLPMDYGTIEQRRSVGAGDVAWLHHHRLPGVKTMHNWLARIWASGAIPAELMPDRRPRRPSVSPLHWFRTARAARSVHSVSAEELDAVLDLSGFAYGDAWGARDIRLRRDYYRHLRRHGARIVLLAQQLGPFKRRGVRDAFAALYQEVDLVFARDSRSFAAAKEAVGDDGKLRLAPDFTVRRGAPGSPRPDLAGRACIVPNMRMLDKASAGAAAAYEVFLLSAVDALVELGCDPFVLIHDSTGEDQEIGERLRARRPGLELVIDADPFALKRILGRASLVVGSRFHALVGALSQGVPVLAAGWSHKYPALLADYGCPELLVDPRIAQGRLKSLIGSLVDPGSRSAIVATLTAKEAERVRQVDLMWRETCQLLLGGPGGGGALACGPWRC